jgi:predicted permease
MRLAILFDSGLRDFVRLCLARRQGGETMTIVLPTLAVTFAAFCVWLTVRVVNRRERRARWTAVAFALLLPSAYLMASYVINGVPRGEEDSEGVTIKTTAAVLAIAGTSVWSFAWFRFARPDDPGN